MSLRYEIIDILEHNARTSHEDIAAMTGHPVETVKTEITHMEKEGMILGYKTIINPEKGAEEVVSCLVELSVQPERGHGFEHIAERIYRFPEVKSVFLVSGKYDFLILVEGNSMRSVADFIADKLAVIPNIRSQSSHFLLKKYKEMGAVLMDSPTLERIPVSP
jgi:DNA-binding Lrp family transcriptional regulator